MRTPVVLCLQGGGCAGDPGPHEDLKHLLPGCAAQSSQPLPTLPTTHPGWGLGMKFKPLLASQHGGGGWGGGLKVPLGGRLGACLAALSKPLF